MAFLLPVPRLAAASGPARLIVLGLVCAWSLVGCIDGDTGENPPPARAAAISAPRAPTPPGPAPAPRPADDEIPEEPTAAVDPEPPEEPEEPLEVADGETDAPAEPAAVSRSAVAIQLLDALKTDAVSSPHAAKRPILPKGKRSYLNPWRNQPFDYRVVWSDGARAEFALRSTLALPTPGRATWALTVPPAATLRFGLAVGARVPKGEAVRITATVQSGGKTTTLLAEDEPSRPLHKVKHWREVAVDLSAFAGQSIELTLEAAHPGAGYRYTAFFAEPMITTRAPRQLREAPNVLFIVVDAMRADLVGPERERRGLPSLFPASEGLARDGAVATQAFAVGNQTRLSTFSFLTAQYPSYGRFYNRRWAYTDAQRQAFYDSRPPLLPRLLRKLGYRTVGVANNLFVFGNLELSFDGGFDRFIDHRHGTKDTAWITETATRWIREHKDQRWMMMVNYNGPHQPYQPPRSVMDELSPQLEGVKGFSKPYLGEVKFTDDHIATLLKSLDELGLTDDTLVIVTSDHGEVMDPEHECYNKNWDSNCHYNHGKTLYDEEIHVPWVMRLPGRIPAGTVVKTPVSHVDLGPTILGLVGARPAPSQLGRDMSAVFRGGAAGDDAPIMAEARLATALRWRGYKYIVHDRREMMRFERKTLFDARRSLEELYDLSADPGELNNLVFDSPPPILAEMRARLQSIRTDLAARRGEPAPEPLAVAAPESETIPPEPDEPAETDTDPHGHAPSPEKASARPDDIAPGVKAGATPEEAHAVWTQVVYPHAGQLVGRIDARAIVEVLPLDLPAEAVVQDETGLRINFTGGAGRGFRFRTEPPDAPIRLQLQADGKPLGPDSLFVGSYGLRLVDGTTLGPNELSLAHAHRPPPIAPDVAHGLFLWRTGTALDDSGDLESADELDAEVRDMMKTWGYTGK